METLLILGSETVVGANAAAHWRTSGAAEVVDASLAGFAAVGLDKARAVIDDAEADRVVLCNPASESAWSSPDVTAAAVDDFRVWVRATRDAGLPLTFISSDAALTGPRLFHREDSDAFCDSAEAGRVREMEELVARVMPETGLVLRTHAFGFAPAGDGPVESILDGGDVAALLRHCDPFAHATPILATDLADVILRAHEEGLTGLLHAGGAERVCQSELTRAIAAAFDVAAAGGGDAPSLGKVASGFGRGESALDSRRTRDLLNLAAPLLREGIDRLVAQEEDGFRALVSGQGFQRPATVSLQQGVVGSAA